MNWVLKDEQEFIRHRKQVEGSPGIGKKIRAKGMKKQGMLGGWPLVHCGWSLRCMKAEIGEFHRKGLGS